MALITARCDDCGDVDLRSRDIQVTVILHENNPLATACYSFLCPYCNIRQVKQADEEVVEVLESAGVPVKHTNVTKDQLTYPIDPTDSFEDAVVDFLGTDADRSLDELTDKLRELEQKLKAGKRPQLQKAKNSKTPKPQEQRNPNNGRSSSDATRPAPSGGQLTQQILTLLEKSLPESAINIIKANKDAFSAEQLNQIQKKIKDLVIENATQLISTGNLQAALLLLQKRVKTGHIEQQELLLFQERISEVLPNAIVAVFEKAKVQPVKAVNVGSEHSALELAFTNATELFDMAVNAENVFGVPIIRQEEIADLACQLARIHGEAISQARGIRDDELTSQICSRMQNNLVHIAESSLRICGPTDAEQLRSSMSAHFSQGLASEPAFTNTRSSFDWGFQT